MAIDPSIPLSIKHYQYDPSVFQNAQAGALQRRQLEAQFQEQAMERQAKEAERQAYGEMFSGGMGGRPDPAKLGALGRVNPQAAFKIMEHFQRLDENGRKMEGDKWKAAGPVLARLKTVPAEQRGQFIQSAFPQLAAAGWSQEELMNVDLSDQSIDALSSAAMTVSQVVDSQTVKWNPIGENGSFATDQYGNPTGSGNPFAPQSGQPAQSGSQGGVVSEGPRASEFRFSLTPGAIETSAYRDPAKNKRVGGVANSYHTRKDATGNAMARDLVPPPGMSMGDFHADLKRRNPHLDVINEGDHVHLEPSTAKVNKGDILKKANEAIARGADRAAVQQRLREMGIIR